ncbi:hypothetical protein C8J57DRAFT_1229632 [Mycena rebaudengoi]|nr:hypothetical protein C8J57DRAFT_1229632 [Mycena rebaudengoi]
MCGYRIKPATERLKTGCYLAAQPYGFPRDGVRFTQSVSAAGCRFLTLSAAAFALQTGFETTIYNSAAPHPGLVDYIYPHTFGAEGESGAVVDSVGGVIVRVAQGKVVSSWGPARRAQRPRALGNCKILWAYVPGSSLTAYLGVSVPVTRRTALRITASVFSRHSSRRGAW